MLLSGGTSFVLTRLEWSLRTGCFSLESCLSGYMMSTSLTDLRIWCSPSTTASSKTSARLVTDLATSPSMSVFQLFICESSSSSVAVSPLRTAFLSRRTSFDSARMLSARPTGERSRCVTLLSSERTLASLASSWGKPATLEKGGREQETEEERRERDELVKIKEKEIRRRRSKRQ